MKKLAEMVGDLMCKIKPIGVHTPEGTKIPVDDIATQLAASLVEARTVRTLEDLDALPDGTLTMDWDQDILVKDRGIWSVWASGDDVREIDLDAWLPARVIYLPSDGLPS